MVQATQLRDPSEETWGKISRVNLLVFQHGHENMKQHIGTMDVTINSCFLGVYAKSISVSIRSLSQKKHAERLILQLQPTCLQLLISVTTPSAVPGTLPPHCLQHIVASSAHRAATSEAMSNASIELASFMTWPPAPGCPFNIW